MPEEVRNHLQQRADVTRPQAELERVITICLEQCERLGTMQWGGVKYEGCPRFGRPCSGAFEKWMAALADARTWCEKWGPQDQ